ncbi:hypothetical protein Tco_0946741 [Tanacetum coccineum]
MSILSTLRFTYTSYNRQIIHGVTRFEATTLHISTTFCSDPFLPQILTVTIEYSRPEVKETATDACCDSPNSSVNQEVAGENGRECPLPSLNHDTEIPEMWLPLRKRLCRTTPGPGYRVGRSSSALTYSHSDGGGGQTITCRLGTIDGCLRSDAFRGDITLNYGYDPQSRSVDYGHRPEIQTVISERRKHDYRTAKDPAEPELPPEPAPRGRPTRTTRSRPVTATPPPVTTNPPPVTDPTTTTSVTSAQLQAMIDEGVTAVLAARAATRRHEAKLPAGTDSDNDVAYAMTRSDLKRR